VTQACKKKKKKEKMVVENLFRHSDIFSDGQVAAIDKTYFLTQRYI
jgi:hypothetical protein